MAYGQTELTAMIQQDLEMMEGRREPVKAGFLEKMGVKKVKPTLLHVNPDDEFSDPAIGPNLAIVENYSTLARRLSGENQPVYEEPVQVIKLKEDGYMLLNGHHRWAGSIRARVSTIRIKIQDP